MRSDDGPWPVLVRDSPTSASNYLGTGYARLDGDGLEFVAEQNAFSYGLGWFVGGGLALALGVSVPSFTFLLVGMLAPLVGIVRSVRLAISDLEEQLTGTQATALFEGTTTTVPLAETYDVRRGRWLPTRSYVEVHFGYNGNTYTLIGVEDSMERLLDALERADATREAHVGDSPASARDETATGTRLVTEDAVNRK